MDKKVNLQEIKKFIKQESPHPPGRLPSFRLPRDLSLGGTKPKKVFTPNLNVVRNKDKTKSDVDKSPRSGKRPAEKSKDGSLRQKCKKPRYIQSEGTFSEGMGEIKRPTEHARVCSYAKDRSHTSITIPKLNKSCWNDVNRDRNTAIMEDLVRDEDSDSDHENDYGPVFLEKNTGTDRINLQKKEVKSENTENVLPELPSSSSNPPDSSSNEQLKLHNTLHQYSSLTKDGKMYDDDNPCFSLIRLPNSFMGKVWKEDKEDKEADYTINHMPEGEMGKIRIRKSGKMEMVVQNRVYSLMSEQPAEMVEMVGLFPGEQSISLEPSVARLGTVDERYTVTPKWKELFDCAKKKKKFW